MTAPGSTIRATVEKLAPTGEGVVRTTEGVGLVEGTLPGEEVDVEIVRVSRKVWWGRTTAIHAASPDRRSGGHADGCSACDWAHVDLSAARAAKRALFLETMARIGKLPASLFGALPVEASPAGYRLRSRFHAEGRGPDARIGGFAPRTHRVEPLENCEALPPAARELLPGLAGALRTTGAAASEIATVHSLDASQTLLRATVLADRPIAEALARAALGFCAGVKIVDPEGRLLAQRGEARLWLSVEGRELPATPDTFFQANRFLIPSLFRRVREAASAVAPGRALDAFGGVGLLAGALLDAGHSVTSVEADAGAVREANLARARGTDRGRWRIERTGLLDFAAQDRGREAVVVADPPRAGLGLALSRALAARASSRFIYVSCDLATLARDLAAIREEGFEIAEASLLDLFALTHRVEAVVVLDRVRA